MNNLSPLKLSPTHCSQAVIFIFLYHGELCRRRSILLVRNNYRINKQASEVSGIILIVNINAL